MTIKKALAFSGIAIVCVALIGLITVGLYRVATDPCRCTERKCWTTVGTTVDSEGRMFPTTSVTCRCLKKWCPAEDPRTVENE